MARAKKDTAAFAFADPANPTLHELNLYTQSLTDAKAAPEIALEATGLTITTDGNLTITDAVIVNPSVQPADDSMIAKPIKGGGIEEQPTE